jgi:APA family basic amino acid/polyamine antiporter
VIALYAGVNFICLRVLGADGLASTTAPATSVMELVLGRTGAALIAVGIAVSTLGFLSQGMLTAPRVYFAMAEDGLFFRTVARVHPVTRVPAVAIALQGVVAVIIAVSGRYEQILNYVVSVDFLFFGLTGVALFVFRRRARVESLTSSVEGDNEAPVIRLPGHPVTTAIFVGACWAVALSTMWQYPQNSAIGVGILLAGIPAYWMWSRSRGQRPPS